MTLRISLLLMLVTFLGCTTEIQRAQTAQPVEEKAQEERAKKPTMPTFTYRPGS